MHRKCKIALEEFTHQEAVAVRTRTLLVPLELHRIQNKETWLGHLSDVVCRGAFRVIQ